MSSCQTDDALDVEAKRKAGAVFRDAHVHKYQKDLAGGHVPIMSNDEQQADERYKAALVLRAEVLELYNAAALVGHEQHRLFIMHLLVMLGLAIGRVSRRQHWVDVREALAAATDNLGVRSAWAVFREAWLYGHADEIVATARLLLGRWQAIVF